MVKKGTTMARRGENIYKRKDGRWEGRVPNGYLSNGKRKYRSLYAKSYSELKVKIRNYNELIIDNPENSILYMDELFKLWIEDKQYTWKKSTHGCYVHLLEHQILPAIGSMKIAEFDTSAFNQFITSKKCNMEAPISDTYLKNITNLIIQAMRYVKNEYNIDINIPSVSTKKENISERILPDSNTMHLLKEYLFNHAQDNTCLGILLCWYTGLRIGELSALCWKDIDLDNQALYIRKTMQRVRIYENNKSVSKVMITVPKTRKSIRTIPIPNVIFELLKRYQREPEEYLIQGTKLPYAEPRTVQYRFRRILRNCEIPPFNFHMLRHSFATSCVISGFDVNSLSEILGHSSIQITLNLYVHSSNERKKVLMKDFHL